MGAAACCRVPGCASEMKALGLCRRHYDMARKREHWGEDNPFLRYSVRTRGEYVKSAVKKRVRFALCRCRCGELHLKELGCAACRVAKRRWFLKRAAREALLQTKEE